ncbi:hypothetical protein R3P38DRAFT_2565172, partial [Favolaschia claudopus]
EWFESVYPQVAWVPLGDRFNGLLESFTKLERAFGWDNPSRGLPKINRPAQVSAWVTHGRGSRGGIMREGAGPALADAEAFGKQWWAWWGKLQPAWRVPKDGAEGRFVRGEFPGVEKDMWSSLRFSGQNGVLSLIACLFWWGRKLTNEQRDGEGDWREAVDDLTWMVNGLLAAEEAGQAAA